MIRLTFRTTSGCALTERIGTRCRSLLGLFAGINVLLEPLVLQCYLRALFFDSYEAGFPLFGVLLTNAPLGVTMTLTWGALY